MTGKNFTGLWGGTLWTALLLWAFLSLPGEACALVNYGTQITHQSNETTNAAKTKVTTQDKLNFYYNASGRPSSSMSLQGKLSLDIVNNKREGTDATQMQPSLNLRLSTRAAQFGLGYREILRDDSIISGNLTRNLTSDSKDMFFDSGLSIGNLPSIRARYNTRQITQENNGVQSADSVTNELSVGTNYNVGIFSLNADYRLQGGEDMMLGDKTSATDLNGQMSMAKNFGPNLAFSLRETYSYSKSEPGGGVSTENATSATEAKMKLRILKRGAVTSTYVYRTAEDLLVSAAKSAEKTWNTNASYAFPKYIRIYGVYSTRDTDAPASFVTNNTTVAGINFKHRVGRLDLTARYEKRVTTVERTTAKASTTTESSRNNFDWVANLNLARYLNLSLSEAYVLSTTAAGETTSDQYRLKLNIGPLKNFLMAPYVDYTVTAGTAGIETTTTVLTVPASYRMTLHNNLDLNITDNYTWRGSGGVSTAPSSQNNSAVVRLTLRRPLPGTTVTADASFNSSSTENGPTTSTSSYSVSGSWNKYPHVLSCNMRYQIGSNAVSSSTYGLQYGVFLRMRKLVFNFQARYSYSVTNTTPESTGQSIYMMLNVKK